MGPEKHMKMDTHGKSTAKIQPLSGQHWGGVIRKAVSVGATFFIDFCALAFSW